MDIIEQAKRNADLLIPKLEGLRNTAGSGRIHDVLGHLALVSNYRWMIDKPGRNDPLVIATETLDICAKAEKFMMEVVR